MKTKIQLSFYLLLFLPMAVMAQNNKSDNALLKMYRNNPVWIQMMEDPNVNYNEAVLAFEEFWRGKPNPLELMEGEEEGEREEHSKRLSERKREDIIKYAMDYKRFVFWQHKYQGFVKPDGTIMTQEDIQALIEQELRNRQNSNR